MDEKHGTVKTGEKQLDEEHGIGGPEQKQLNKEAGYPEIYGEKGAVSKKEKKAALVIVLMFIMFLAASAFAVYFYLDDNEFPLNESLGKADQSQCLGMVDPSQCETLVDCSTDEPVDSDDPKVVDCDPNKDCDLEVSTVNTLGLPKAADQRSGKYYVTYDICYEFGRGIGTPCLDKREVEYEVSSDSLNLITICSATGVESSTVTTQDLISGYPDSFGGTGCFGEGNSGHRLLIVNDSLMVGLKNQIQ